MLLCNYELISFDPAWMGVLVGVSLGLLTLIGLAVNNSRRSKHEKALKRTPTPLLSSIPELNNAIEFTGFAYDEIKDIFYSVMNPWQREYGYCRFYDEAAATLSMIIDAEPIYFEYGGKQWLIEFWKGQYGMTTGGEVGVYNADNLDKNLFDWNGRLYNSASDNELLNISMIIYKNGRPLFSRRADHWWLTGFVLGEFSKPEELSMDIAITFHDSEMRDAFIGGLNQTGYREHEYVVRKNSVAIRYGVPRSPQPLTRTKLTDKITQDRNEELCKMYQKITEPYNSIVDKLNVLRQQDEQLYDQAIHFGKQRELFSSLNKLKR